MNPVLSTLRAVNFPGWFLTIIASPFQLVQFLFERKNVRYRQSDLRRQFHFHVTRLNAIFLSTSFRWDTRQAVNRIYVLRCFIKRWQVVRRGPIDHRCGWRRGQPLHCLREWPRRACFLCHIPGCFMRSRNVFWAFHPTGEVLPARDFTGFFAVVPGHSFPFQGGK